MLETETVFRDFKVCSFSQGWPFVLSVFLSIQAHLGVLLSFGVSLDFSL